MSRPDRSTNQDVVPEQTNEVEEAADIAAEDRATSRIVHDSSSIKSTRISPAKPSAQLLHESSAHPSAVSTAKHQLKSSCATAKFLRWKAQKFTLTLLKTKFLFYLTLFNCNIS